MEELKRNFEFVYTGRGRHLCAGPGLEKPMNALREMGGLEQMAFSENGIDREDEGHYARGFSFAFSMFQFPGHTVKAYCTREEYPEHESMPMHITRIRLGNYDLRDPFVSELSAKLCEIPEVI